VVHTYIVLGHVDGVKADPITHKVWTLENEDGNTRLVIIDPETQKHRFISSAPGHTAGVTTTSPSEAARCTSARRTR